MHELNVSEFVKSLRTISETEKESSQRAALLRKRRVKVAEEFLGIILVDRETVALKTAL